MQTEALTLKTWPYSESTLIVSLLTPEHGVIRVMAKGARRLTGRTAATLDLLAHLRANVRLASGDGLGNLGSTELIDSWDYLRTDLKRFALASVGMEIVSAVATFSPHEPFFFLESIDFLRGLQTSEAPGSLTAALLLRLLHHAGYPPRLAEGAAGGSIAPKMVYDFYEGTIGAASAPGSASPEIGSDAIDRSREATSTAPGGRYFPLPGPLVEQIAGALGRPPHLDERFILPTSHGAVALRWLVRVWEDHLNQKIQSLDFLEKTVLRS